LAMPPTGIANTATSMSIALDDGIARMAMLVSPARGAAPALALRSEGRSRHAWAEPPGGVTLGSLAGLHGRVQGARDDMVPRRLQARYVQEAGEIRAWQPGVCQGLPGVGRGLFLWAGDRPILGGVRAAGRGLRGGRLAHLQGPSPPHLPARRLGSGGVHGLRARPRSGRALQLRAATARARAERLPVGRQTGGAAHADGWESMA